MAGIDGEELGYRSPIQITQATEPDKDHDNFSTLEDVYKKFKADLDDLQHVNSFDVIALKNEDEATKVLLRQIYAKQEAYKILEPLCAQLESAVKDIKEKEEGK
jgi:hypothetical protein